MQTFLQRFFQASAWPMQTPEPYSMFHIVLTAAGLLTAVFGARMLATRSRGKRSSDRVLLVCGLALAVSELYKQGFLYYIVDGGVYDWWYFPFQLCSVPMYLCLVIPLLGGNAAAPIRRSLCTFIQDFGLLGGIMALAEPTGLFHPYWTLTLHGLCWHFMLVFLGLYCALDGSSCREPGGFTSVLPLFAACCVIAAVINVTARPLGSADMFYISPYYPNGQLVFHAIALKIGITAGSLIYLAGVVLGGLLCHMACWRLTARRFTAG